MNKSCNAPILSKEDVQLKLKTLHTDWILSDDQASIRRCYEFKGFAKAVYLTNLCVWLADLEGHHPDIAFGWGYCNVTLTTHDCSGLTELDFSWATKLDTLCNQANA